MSYLANAQKLKAKIDANQLIADTVSAAGGIREDLKQSDKLGFDWRIFYVNDVPVKTVYVEQAEPFGTAEKPIVWKEGMSLIPNAYYTHNGIRKVWTGDTAAFAAWDDERFTEF